MIKQGSADIPGIERVIKLAKDNDVGVITIKPMTGNFIPYWAKQVNDPEIQEIMKKLKNYGPQNLYQAMLRWILQNPDVTACAVGMDTVQQVIEDVMHNSRTKITVDCVRHALHIVQREFQFQIYFASVCIMIIMGIKSMLCRFIMNCLTIKKLQNVMNVGYVKSIAHIICQSWKN
jgi:predicted aldo/keto reductase-like oxidoreductase